MKTKIILFGLISSLFSCAYATALKKEELINISQSMNIQHPFKGEHYTYKGQDYYLILTKTQYVLKAKEKDEPSTDVIDIGVKFITTNPAKNNKKYVQWSINDFVHCLGLDFSAEFLPQAITFNQINPHFGNEYNANVTVGYKLFCGGGVDPKILKIIYRDKDNKFALRGESLIFINDKESIGGQYTVDKQFKFAPKEIQTHLINLWNLVKKDN